MSQVILNSNKASIVQNTLTKEPVHSLAYSTDESFPNVSKKCSVVSPYIPVAPGSMHDGNETYNIPRSQFWYLGRLQFNYNGNLLASVNGHENLTFIGLNIIRQIDFLCNGQSFMKLTGEAIKALIMNSENDAFQEHTYRYALPLARATELPYIGTATPGDPLTSYVPLFGSWFMSPEKALNCSELEQIQLVITYKTHTESGLSAPLAGFSSRLHTYKYLPDSETYSKIVSMNMKSPLLECFNTETERVPLTATGVAEWASGIFYPVYKTHIFVMKNSSVGAVGVFGNRYWPITSLSLNIGGEDYMTNFTKSMINYEQACFGNSSRIVTNSTAITMSENQCYTVDYSLLGKRSSNSGLASMANLNKPTFRVTIPVNGNADGGDLITSYSLYLVHEYFNILQIDPASKVISVSANK